VAGLADLRDCDLMGPEMDHDLWRLTERFGSDRNRNDLLGGGSRLEPITLVRRVLDAAQRDRRRDDQDEREVCSEDLDAVARLLKREYLRQLRYERHDRWPVSVG
jgi:hypothetical protein